MFQANFCPSSGAQDLDFFTTYGTMSCYVVRRVSERVYRRTRSAIFTLPTLMMHGQTQIKFPLHVLSILQKPTAIQIRWEHVTLYMVCKKCEWNISVLFYSNLT
jgi:hypothetical protein